MLTIKVLFLFSLLAAGLFCVSARGEVVFSEDFESGNLGDRWEKYTEDPARGDFETRPVNVHSGKRSYRITALPLVGEAREYEGRIFRDADSWIRTWFLPGHDVIYIRWYAKFAEDSA